MIPYLYMKSQSNLPPNGRSLFSLNTINTAIQSSANLNNDLHKFYYSLLGESNYPHLSKILFLQLVLRQNFVIYSNRRVEVKEVWNQMNKKLGEKVANIYIMDQSSKIQEILANRSQYKRVLLYDLTAIANSGLNHLINNQQQTVTLTILQQPQKLMRPQLTDLFPFVFYYDGEEQEIDLLNQKTVKNQQTPSKFQKQKFYETVTKNFSLTLENRQEQGFLKSYLSMMRQKAAHLNIPNTRWKKMLKVLHFIGLTKNQGGFKRFSLSDCLFVPECLGRNCNELQSLKKINEQILTKYLPYFGIPKWVKQLAGHFWLSDSIKSYFISISQKLRGKVSYFYPCSKYPQTVKLLYEQSTLCTYFPIKVYRIFGFDKKLMSDKYFQIQQGKQYRLTFNYRCKQKVISHFGVACYDQDKNIINPVQVCRFQDTAIVVDRVQGNRIYWKKGEGESVKRWKGIGSFAYQKCIGVYYNGNKQKFISLEDVLYTDSDSYKKEDNSGVYQSIGEDYIELTERGEKLILRLKDRIISGTTKIMNHYQGGTYAIGITQSEPQPNWKQISSSFNQHSRLNTGKSFLLGTRYVRIVLMSNYNSGYPQFKVQSKGTSIDICQIQWLKL